MPILKFSKVSEGTIECCESGWESIPVVYSINIDRYRGG